MNESIRHSAAAMREAGSSPEAVVNFLHASGCTPMESIKIVREVFGVALGEAKALVSSHPSFKDVAAAADELHEAILKDLGKH